MEDGPECYMSWTQQAILGLIMLSLDGSTKGMDGSIVVCIGGDVSVLKYQHQPSAPRNKMTACWSCSDKLCVWNLVFNFDMVYPFAVHHFFAQYLVNCWCVMHSQATMQALNSVVIEKGAFLCYT